MADQPINPQTPDRNGAPNNITPPRTGEDVKNIPQELDKKQVVPSPGTGLNPDPKKPDDEGVSRTLFFNKYLKYKKKYIELKNQTGGSLTETQIDEIRSTVRHITLPKDTLLYRVQSTRRGNEVIPRNDPDTRKIGIYFSNTIHIPIGMNLEYNKEGNLLIYKTTEDIKLYIGKYSFRLLEPTIFFKNIKDYELYTNAEQFNKLSLEEIRSIVDKNPVDKKYWNHIDHAAFPIHNIFLENTDKWGKLNIAEIFLNNNDKLEFVSSKIYNVEESYKLILDELKKL